ncbi:hypothetical protein D3C76_192620 [compost metagenome]
MPKNVDIVEASNNTGGAGVMGSHLRRDGLRIPYFAKKPAFQDDSDSGAVISFVRAQNEGKSIE